MVNHIDNPSPVLSLKYSMKRMVISILWAVTFLIISMIVMVPVIEWMRAFAVYSAERQEMMATLEPVPLNFVDHVTWSLVLLFGIVFAMKMALKIFTQAIHAFADATRDLRDARHK